MAESLRSLRNSFYLGLHKQAQKDAKASKEPLADVFYYRSLLAQENYEAVIKGIGTSSSPELQAVRLLATYKTAAEDNKELALEQMKEWQEAHNRASGGSGTPKKEGDSPLSPTLQLLCSQILFEAKNYKEALKFVHKSHENLEHLAMTVQIYLKIDRADLAARQVKAMQDIDDDDTLTALANAWLNIAMGGEKCNEALNLLQELQDKFSSSSLLLNAQATCQIAVRNYTAAFTLCKRARDEALATKEKVSPETLVNTIVSLLMLRKPADIIQRVVGELRTTSPNHPWLARSQAMEASFDKSASGYK